MKKAIQDGLLSIYRSVQRSGALDSRLGRRLFLGAYWSYKRLWEPDIGFLRQFVPSNSWVVDVGANVGFFAHQFCEWVSEDGRVLAFEPEQRNFDALQDMSRRFGHSEVLIARRLLLADADTTLHLVLNPDNPADHHIGNGGIPTPAAQLDTVVRELGWPRVGLVKIDVQGAECRVLEGARETLDRSRPVLLVEVDDRALRRFGMSAEELRRWLLAHGYEMYEATPEGLGAPIDGARAAFLITRIGYADFVFLPETSGRTRR